MGGTLEYLSDLLGGCSSSSRRRYNRRTQFQTVELKVRMDCDGCEMKVRNALSRMKGVHSVEIDRKQSKVTVQGYVEPHKVVKRVQATGKKAAEIWPYVPYSLVAHPYAAPAYDRKAPPGYVRRVDAVMPASSYGGPTAAGPQEERLVNMFSDDNPNACSIM
ncbi:metal ion binding protein [Zea mays]|uniref:Heavy metal transport/detoxification superfamily protein n=1 Tax=Zea mays TaxID=4577 RepID=C0P643_MAIZE|nr:metal ion binding protein [Zea mays]ACN28459.1 unknown [Zea mays]ONM21623.1 Heavy metal transport/detoxification superfamily protein [Zea mays]